MIHDRIDLDPAPRKSPKLPASVDAIPPRHLSRQTRRIRRDCAIYAMIQDGMTQEAVAELLRVSQPTISRAYRRVVCAKSRV